jgi:hypothetical protein
MAKLWQSSHKSLPRLRATIRCFTLPSMSNKLKLTCLVWPDDKPDEHAVQVEIDINETIMLLKKLIKDEHAHHLAHVDARDLNLWMCKIPVDDNLKETLTNIRFDGTDPSVQRLRPVISEISEHFATTLPRRTIHILVELPTPGECGVRIFFSATEA